MSSTKEAAVQQLPAPAELKEDVSKATAKSLQSLRDFAAGGVGGVFAVVVGHPFDLVKVRMQTAEKGVYSGAMDVVKKTVAKEGLGRVCLFYLFLAGWLAGFTLKLLLLLDLFSLRSDCMFCVLTIPRRVSMLVFLRL